MTTTNNERAVLVVAFVLVVLVLVAGDGLNDLDSRNRSEQQSTRIETNTTDIAELIAEMRLLRESIESLNQSDAGDP